MDDRPTLCFPDREKTCFACCPPIRPAGYEHIQYRDMIKRVLRENTHSYRSGETAMRPITGFSCWALGYLDPGCRLVGCLLHPACNHGEDLRFRIDYGEKCRRETCPEAHIFEQLEPRVRAFWLHLADGLDTFSYSSRSQNALFDLLNWGPALLTLIAKDDPNAVHTTRTLLEAYPLLGTRLSPRAWAYPVTRLAALKGTGWLREAAAGTLLEPSLSHLIHGLRADMDPGSVSPGAPPVHRLPMERSFLDFLRLSLGIRRLALHRAWSLKDRVDRRLDRLLPKTDPEGHPGRACPSPPTGSPPGP